MIKPLPLFIGLRYTRARRRNRFVSFISASSMLGIAVGVMALITVLSVMNGFEKELRERILGMVSHATVQGYESGLTDWQALLPRLDERGDIIGAAPFVNGEVMLTRGSAVTGALVRGIDPARETAVSRVANTLIKGRLDTLADGEYRIILGSRPNTGSSSVADWRGNWVSPPGMRSASSHRRCAPRRPGYSRGCAASRWVASSRWTWRSTTVRWR